MVMKQLANKASRRRAFQRETSFGGALTLEHGWSAQGPERRPLLPSGVSKGGGWAGQERRGLAESCRAVRLAVRIWAFTLSEMESHAGF